jgi:hypothetical protein
MEWFYLTVLAVAILLLIIMLTFIGTRIKKNEKSADSSNNVFPPVQNTCPDLWEATQVDDIIKCKIPSTDNIGSLRNSEKGIITDLAAGARGYDNDTMNFSSYETECEKKRWADQFNIKWDGISNYNQC